MSANTKRRPAAAGLAALSAGLLLGLPPAAPAQGPNSRIQNLPRLGARSQVRPVTYYHDGAVCTVTFSPDSQHVASGSCDTTIKIAQVQDGKVLRTLKGHTACVLSVVYTPDGKFLISGSKDRTVRFWN